MRGTGLLDSEVEDTFDRLTRLAVKLLGIPAAFISLVDENRDFYKSACGFDSTLSKAREMEGPTFCHYAIEQSAPLVIPDTAGDPRYRDLPTVKTLGIAAYVGVPMLVNGQAIGSFCAIDRQPHPWSEREVEVLVELAKSAQREIELRSRAAALARANASLAESEVRFRTVQDASPVGFTLQRAVAGQDGAEASGFQVTFVNDAGVRLLERTRTAVLGSAIQELFPGGIGHQVREALLAVLHSGVDWSAELCGTDDCEDIGYEFTAVRVGEEAALIFSDISERLRSTREREFLLASLTEERLQLQRLLDASPTVMAIYEGPTHVITHVNPTWERTVGKPGAIGMTFRDVFPEFSESGLFERLEDVYRTGEPFRDQEVNVPLRRWPGSPMENTYWDLVWQRISSVASTGASPEFAVLTHAVDVTSKVLARREIEEARGEAVSARERAEHANESKSQFLVMMSHELRTPLNAIGGYAELLEMGIHGEVSEAQLDFLARIRRSQRHLLGLINGVLHFAKLEAGALHYEIVDVPIEEIVATCEALVAPQVREKGQHLSFDACEETMRVRGDLEKVQQIVLNLASNAVKFTDDGGHITISCSSRDDGMLTLSVTDTGRGIPADKAAQLFKPFMRVESEPSQHEEGTGLGLAISRELARGMGGDITLESEESVGSTFTLVLPQA